MATKLYFHAAASSVGGTLPGAGTQSSFTPNFSDPNASVNRDMSTTPGSAQTSAGVTASYGAVSTLVFLARFISPPLNGAQATSGTNEIVTISAAADETSLNANRTFTAAAIYVWRPSTGARIGFLIDNAVAAGTEPGTTETALTKTHACNNVAASNGDVVVVEAWSSGTPSMAASYTENWYYDGTTEASITSCAAFISWPTTTMTFQAGAAAGSLPPSRQPLQGLIQRAATRDWKERASGLLAPEGWQPAPVI